jgi:hypothetical protein
MGLPPPYPSFLCPLFSNEFVEPPPPEKNSWVSHWLFGMIRNSIDTTTENVGIKLYDP